MSITEIRSSIDLGTNTCLLLVAEWDPDKNRLLRILGDYATIIRLGECVDRTRMFSPEAMNRAISCLKEYCRTIRKFGVEPAKTVCIATSSARDSKNRDSFFKTVKNETGLDFRVISGEEEAKLTFFGALLPGMDPEQIAVIDIGGGSTEFISATGGKSLDVGCVRFTERFLKSDPVTEQEFMACKDAIDSELAVLKNWRATLHPKINLLAVAGTATTLASWFKGQKIFDRDSIDHTVLVHEDLHKMVEELKRRTIHEKKQLLEVESGRADVLLCGAMILWRTLEVLEFSGANVSTRGLRFGALLSSQLLSQ